MKKFIHAGRVGSVGLFIINFISAVSFLGGVSAVLFGVSFGAFVPVASAMMLAPHVCCSNIAFIPGFEGSRLYEPSALFGEYQLWEPFLSDDVKKLYLDSNGQSVNSDIYTKGIIDESVIGGLNIYKNFEGSLDGMVADHTIAKWEALPYDWRKDPSDVVVGGSTIKNNQGNFDVLNFANEIEKLAATSNTSQVTIIAHSNGGLIAKLLVQELQKRGEVGLVDKVILVAVPELGTPKAIPAILNGYGQELGLGVMLSDSVARSLAKNMQSVYNLLPSREYFNRVTDPVVTIDPAVSSLSTLDKDGTTINSFDALQSFLTGQNDDRVNPASDDTNDPIVLGSNFLTKSDNTHGALDNWQFPNSIAVSQIAGWGLDTVSGVKYTVGKDCGIDSAFCTPILDEVPMFTSDGDNTVVTPSATAINARNTKTYYVNLPEHNNQLYYLRVNRGHANILEVAELQQLIRNIVSEKSDIPDIITTDKPQPDSKQSGSLHISVHSPVSIDAYDATGNHTGLIPNPNPNSDLQLVEQNIPNSFYMNFGEGKYIGVPVDASTTIKLQGLGYGTFTLNIDAPAGSNATSSVFTDIPVTPMTTAHIEASATTTPQLALDIDGDGKDDFILKPNTNFDPILYLQSVRQTVISFDLKKAVEKTLLANIDRVLELVKKGKIAKAETKVKKFIFRVQKKKAKKIDDSDKTQFVSMLNQLLDNLNQ